MTTMPRGRLISRLLVLGLAALVLGGCGSDGSTDAESGAGGSQGKEEELKIAMLVGSAANAYHAAVIEGAKAAAQSEGASLTIYESGFDPAKSIAQFEDVLALGKTRFDGVGILPIDNVTPLPVVRRALDEDWTVGVANGVVGERVDATEIQVDGLAVQAASVWKNTGVKVGDLIVEACEGVDPCKVGWAFGLSQWTAEKLVFEMAEGVIGEHPNIELSVKVGDTAYTREGGLKIIGTMIQKHSDLDVIFSVDQALLGAEPALTDAGLLGKVKLIGWGGSIQSKSRIEDGQWYGVVAGAPTAEGEYLVKGILSKIRTGEGLGFVDTADTLPNSGVITEANVEEFNPQFSG